MNFKILKTETDYEKALHKIDAIFDAKQNTEKGAEFELLSLLIDNYEEAHYPIDLPHPIEAIKFRMDQMGLKQKDLVDCFGDKSKVSECLTFKTKTKSKLHQKLHIPLDTLIADYDTANSLV